ncbi:FUSC family protein [Gordonia sp. ABSL11-1]|uniref:FUSC family protein n=1 Tax=Gordonia sp. ABSL11-1 TaxID=3053924 RepID=UPI0025726F84|nr:FUSC family protein [Gordonia sp. ABSL11-1]MDL9948359.1 FUSC family protein [Gordonia sp. ABSL11-1]
MRDVGRVVITALRPGPRPYAVAAALRALVAAGVIAVVGAVVGDLAVVGIAYLAAACSVAFVIGGTYRNRSIALCAQGVGAAGGILVGATLDSGPTTMIAVAAIGGLVSGLVGGIGPNAPAFGMMLSIGIAFGQFGGSDLTPWRQAVWYGVGTFVVAAATVSPWIFRRGAIERAAAADVLDSAADLCAAVGTGTERAARARLTTASATARLARMPAQVQQVSFAVSAIHADAARATGPRVPPGAVDALRAAARQTCAGMPIAVDTSWDVQTAAQRALVRALRGELDPTDPHGRLQGALRTLRTPTSWLNATRLAACLGVATAITAAAHEPAHSFWLPLTVAVIVRPEYGSVVVRTINRVAGSVVGALVAAGVLALWPSGVPVAAAAAVSLGFAVLTAPKLYALSVIGVTSSALLAVSIGHGDAVLPVIRVIDTLAGAAVAVVVGYLLWPGARRLPQPARLTAACAAAQGYLEQAVLPRVRREQWTRRRDDAYLLAHQAKDACLAALAEPPPVPAVARRVLPTAVELEETTDAITALAVSADVGEDVTARATAIGRRLDTIRRAAHAADRA